jgi:hypothetical protein
MEALEFRSTIDEDARATSCTHCGADLEEIGLVAPRCVGCGRFSMEHISFGPPTVVEVDVVVETPTEVERIDARIDELTYSTEIPVAAAQRQIDALMVRRRAITG